jgi:[acyl-carrier-protein] S-malonyltransferase
MSHTVGLFPGQGSQYVGMGSRLAASSPAAALVFDRAEEATGVDVRKLCWTAPGSELERTENAQLALMEIPGRAKALASSGTSSNQTGVARSRL